MRLQIPSTDLASAIKKARQAVKKEPVNEILKNIMLEASDDDRLSVMATDASKTILVECLADVSEVGSSAVMGIDFHKLVKKLPVDESVELHVEDNDWCGLECGSVKSRVAGMSARNFPDVRSTLVRKHGITIRANTLLKLFEKTHFCVDKKDTRVALTGVYMKADQIEGKLTTMATNGHRLAVCKADLQDLVEADQDMISRLEHGIIIPGDVVEDLMSFITEEDNTTVDIYAYGNTGVVFSQVGWRLATQTIDANFPSFSSVLPEEYEYPAKFDRADMKEVIGLVSLFAEEDSNRVKLRLSNGRASMEAVDPGRGEVEYDIEVEYEGGDALLAYQVQYLKNAVNHLDSKDVVFGIIDSKMPTFIEDPDDDDVTLVVMPMRVK